MQDVAQAIYLKFLKIYVLEINISSESWQNRLSISWLSRTVCI